MKAVLRYLVYDPDPRGNERYYVRMKGRPKIRIRETFRNAEGEITDEFMAAYKAAIASLKQEGPQVSRRTPAPEGTFEWLFDQFYRSPTFAGFDKATQKDKASVLDRFCETAGRLPYRKFRHEDMVKSQQKRAATPGAADKLVKVLRALFNWAMDQTPPLATYNPAARVKPIHKSQGGFHTWLPEEIDKFRAFWPIGSMPRLALEIMVAIGARRSDAALIGPANEVRHDGKRWLRFTPYKGRNNYPVTIETRMTPELIEALANIEGGSKTFITWGQGRSYTIESFGNAFGRWCEEAGLPHCSCHGLRKAASVAYAESGATAPELMAVFGWTNLKTAQGYIEKAQKRIMARNAADRLERHRERESVSLSGSETPDETNEGKSDE
ncbi:tyrosine-type recombinase/integrase [Shinella fusca]|uniref:Integrase n=1 Tax=Shinella fusca TaxID=544480 RepID=A0A7W7YXM4_9HYPH|nr:tyrosine-type recombinase/integrase [Shinella fusca]MBB5044037.1 integrase [Shinella fusca]